MKLSRCLSLISSFISIDPQSETLSQDLENLCNGPGVYLLSTTAPSHFAWSSNLKRRLTRLLTPADPASAESVIGRLRSKLIRIDLWRTGSRLESALVLYLVARTHFPNDYVKRLRLRFPWFVALLQNDAFPRLSVTNRILARHPPLFGPFISRDSAQRYLEEVSGLFQIRRCTEQLSPHPDHPGCIYGEMNQCLRPCQQAVSAEEYATEVGRVAEFLNSNGRATLGSLSVARDRACELLDFEQAAQLHKRIEKLTVAASARPDIVSSLEQFNGIAVTGSGVARQVKLWPMLRGFWQDPITLDFSQDDPSSKSLDQTLRAQLEVALADPRRDGSAEEELGIFSKWYYSTWRDGEWFPFQNLSNLNYRRLVREISNRAKAQAVPIPQQ